jgi:type IV pilus assembly protein PilC
VDAGEKGGILETLLHKIASYKEKTEALKAKVKKAMSYPIAVVVVAFIITSILLIYVIPQFEELFSSFGADLPALTMMVMQLSIVFQEWWYVIFGGIFAAVFAFKQAKLRSEAFRRVLDRVSLKIPIFGDITEKSIVARFARTLSTMFAAGVPLVDSLDSVAGAAGNSLYSDAILRIRDDISTGTQLNVSMKNTGMFPSMVVQMVAIGEESGSLDQMLSKVADFYEEEVDNLVDSLSSLLEPIIMAFLGVVIGGLVIAMYLPIFQMGQVV